MITISTWHINIPHRYESYGNAKTKVSAVTRYFISPNVISTVKLSHVLVKTLLVQHYCFLVRHRRNKIMGMFILHCKEELLLLTHPNVRKPSLKIHCFILQSIHVAVADYNVITFNTYPMEILLNHKVYVPYIFNQYSHN